MKIEKYTKLKSNKYSVLIDGITVKLYDDVIVKYELLRLKEIDEKLFREITEYNDRLEAYYKALRYITKKLRTEKEIYKYLNKDYNKEIILETIDRLKKYGYLNKNLYLKSYLSDQIHMTLNGPNKIRKDLISLGYEEEEFEEEISNISDEIWLNKIEKVVNKKIKSNRNLGNNKLKEKLVYDLNAPYPSGARLYFDAQKMAADGLLVRDGNHLKVKNQLPLQPYLLWTATWKEIGLQNRTAKLRM